MAGVLLSEPVSASTSFLRITQCSYLNPSVRPRPRSGSPQSSTRLCRAISAVSLVPERLARLHLVVPISVDNRVLTYATFRPLTSEADHDLGFASGRRTTA